MKFTISFVLMFSLVFSHGQDATSNMNKIIFSNPFHSSNQQYLSISNYKIRDLDEFFEFNWTTAEVLNQENDVIILDSANFFIPDQKIVFLNNGKMMEIYPEQVQKLRIENRTYAPFVNEKNKKKGLQFFEVLAGTDFKVLKEVVLREEATSNHPMGIKSSGSKLVKRIKFYYVKEGTEVAKAIPGSKSKFIKVFKRHKKKVLKLVEKRNLSLRDEKGLIIIARYYNHLISEK